METWLTEDELLPTQAILNSFKGRRSVHLIKFQSLISTLQFTCKAVVPGTTFLQHMIDLTRGVPNHFHHIRLNEEFFKDLNMWKAFLAGWYGCSIFLDSTVTLSLDMSLYTNASGAIGFGGYFNGKWFQGRWPPHMQLNKDWGVIIEWQELFPIVVVCAFWFPHFSGSSISSSGVITNQWSWSFAVSCPFIYETWLLYQGPPCSGDVQWDCWCSLTLSGISFPGCCYNSQPNLLYHPAFAHDPLKEVRKYANWGLAWTTNRTYTSGEKQFIQFCRMNRLIYSDGDILPASEGTLIYFSTYLARKVKRSTIKLYFVVHNLHTSCGYGDPPPLNSY